MYLNNIIIENVGAIKNFNLSGYDLFYGNGNPKPIIFLGKNGSGKSTLLSSITDSFFELCNNAFSDILQKKGLGYSYYKLSGGINKRIGTDNGFIYLQFEKDGKFYEYFDRTENVNFDDYNIKIGFHTLQNSDSNKIITATKNDDDFKEDFKNNSYCVFPSNRFERPYWLNDSYLQENLTANITGYVGELNKEILVVSSIEGIKSWILDLFLDSRVDLTIGENDSIQSKQDTSLALNLSKGKENIEKILSSILEKDVEIGINLRGRGASRIKIIDKNNNEIIPSLSGLSAGQSILLSIFGTIIKHSDQADFKKSINLEEIEGIVVIDEIDLHLHIELQKNIVPKLMQMFPKIQFIISTHSPFFLSGIKDIYGENVVLINMPLGNQITDLSEFEEFDKSLELFGNITDDFKDKYNQIKSQLESSTIPLIMCEGKTDVIHIKKSIEKLGAVDLQNIEFFEIPDFGWGESELKKALTYLSYGNVGRKIIGIFDHDKENTVREIDGLKNYGNNVYGFCIPIPEKRSYYNKISIEFYYDDENLKKKDANGNCLYFDNELAFNNTGNVIEILDDEKIIDNPNKQIYDKNIGGIQGIYSKARFAELVQTNDDFVSDFNFSDFNLIIDKIREILAINEE